MSQFVETRVGDFLGRADTSTAPRAMARPVPTPLPKPAPEPPASVHVSTRITPPVVPVRDDLTPDIEPAEQAPKSDAQITADQIFTF